MRPIRENGKYDVVQVASRLLNEERAGMNLKDMQIPLLGDRMADFYPPDFLPVMFSELHSCREPKFSVSKNDFGTTYNAALSLFGMDGKPVALLTAGLSLNFIEKVMKKIPRDCTFHRAPSVRRFRFGDFVLA